MTAEARRSSHTESPDQSTAPPSYKRRRIALACTSCRNRKSRCNGVKPACSLCVELGFECIYQQPAAANGVNTTVPQQNSSGYDERLRAIEDTLRLLVDQNEPSGPKRRESYFRRAEVLEQVEQQQQRQVTVNSDEDVAILDEDDDQPANAGEDSVDGMAAITDPEDRESRFFGPSSNITFLRHISDATSTTLKAIGQSRTSEPPLGQSLVSRAASPVTTLLSEKSPAVRSQYVNIRSLPSESRALHLIQLFFSDTGMLFPYIHEQEILRTYSTARRNRFVSVSRSWLCLLNVIFAFATYISARPDQPAEKNAAESEVFMERAQALADEIELKSANLESVQCFLLMAQYRQGTQRSDKAWILHGKAVRAAIQLGLQSRSTLAGFSSVEAEIRKRTWFACMILDRTLSMTFGRPATIPNSYMTLDLPINQSLDKIAMAAPASAGHNGVETPDTVCLFTATIQLYYILEDIMTQLYGSNIDTDPQLTMPVMLERTLLLEQRMAEWKRNLPFQLQRKPWVEIAPGTVGSPARDPISDRLSVIITLRYLNTRILLHRPVLSTFLQRRARLRADGGAFEDGDHFFHDLGERSIKACEQSASEIVEIVQRTSRPPALLGAWWFSAYYTFNAALVIFSCILLEITTTNRWTAAGPTITVAELLDTGRIIDMITHLRRAAETLQRFGEGMRSAKRIRKTLLKLVHICMNLAQSNNEQGAAILSALSSNYDAEMAQLQQQIGLELANSGGGMVHGPMIAGDGMMLPPTTMDPFATYDVGMHQYWSENTMDLFNDLVGVESGLTSLMAG